MSDITETASTAVDSVDANSEARATQEAQLNLAAISGTGGSLSTGIGAAMMEQNGMGVNGRNKRSDYESYQQAMMASVNRRIERLEKRLQKLDELEGKIRNGEELGNSKEAQELKRRYEQEHGKKYDPNDPDARADMLIIQQQVKTETQKQLDHAKEVARGIERGDPAALKQAEQWEQTEDGRHHNNANLGEMRSSNPEAAAQFAQKVMGFSEATAAYASGQSGDAYIIDLDSEPANDKTNDFGLASFDNQDLEGETTIGADDASPSADNFGLAAFDNQSLDGDGADAPVVASASGDDFGLASFDAEGLDAGQTENPAPIETPADEFGLASFDDQPLEEVPVKAQPAFAEEVAAYEIKTVDIKGEFEVAAADPNTLPERQGPAVETALTNGIA